MILEKKILISYCTEGIYLRWWFNGWHYFLFQNGYVIEMQTENADIMTSQVFSVISKIERPTKITSDYSYRVTIDGIPPYNIEGFTGLLLAEQVEQYEGDLWREVDITRGEHFISEAGENGYRLEFEIRRKELPYSSSVFQKRLKFYIGDTLCDLDDSEIVPINKQTNNIAEMQDRQSDFTRTFKIRKTRAMRELFELSGEVGATTTFPYQRQSCRLVQDGIEMITNGIVVLNSNDDQYYHVSIYSGNLNFFKLINSLKITDLELASTEHSWTALQAQVTQGVDLDYVYPLLEPSDDAGMCPLTDDGDRIDLYAGWIFPFIKIKAIWDEIFDNAGYIVEGNILTNEVFLKLFMPITDLEIEKALTDKYLYSVYWMGSMAKTSLSPLYFPGAIVVNGPSSFQFSSLISPFTATYTFRVITLTLADPVISLFLAPGLHENFTLTGTSGDAKIWELEYDAVAGQALGIWSTAQFYFFYQVSIIKISGAQIGYGSAISPRLHLPDISQTEFVKLICNMFGLIPEVTPRDRKILFWNYLDLYDNIPVARDWSAYLSEREDYVEFKFGDYAQSNYLNYKDSDDVFPKNGRGVIKVEDETLQQEKDVIEHPISTCDEVLVFGAAEVAISRINMNVWNEKDEQYDNNKKIDARIVYVTQLGEVGSPPDEKTFGISDDLTAGVPSGNIYTTDSPKIATSLEASMSNLIVHYSGLSRMLTKTNIRRSKFNLPAYEVAGLKHYVPIYVRQYKAYFYVNKVNNYVPGQLCTVDLVKL